MGHRNEGVGIRLFTPRVDVGGKIMEEDSSSRGSEAGAEDLESMQAAMAAEMLLEKKVNQFRYRVSRWGEGGHAMRARFFSRSARSPGKCRQGDLADAFGCRRGEGFFHARFVMGLTH